MLVSVLRMAKATRVADENAIAKVLVVVEGSIVPQLEEDTKFEAGNWP